MLKTYSNDIITIMRTQGSEVKQIQEHQKRIRRNITGLGLWSLAMGNLFYHIHNPASPIHQGLVTADTFIQNTPGLRELQRGIDFIPYVFSQALAGYDSNLAPMIRDLDFLLVVTSLYLGGKFAQKEYEDYITKTKGLGLRRFKGQETLGDKKPSHIIISQTSNAVSDLVEEGKKTGRVVNSKERPTVGVTFESGVPSVLGQGLDYYFSLNGLPQLFSQKILFGRNKFREITNIDLADEITIICFNPDNGLFANTDKGLILKPRLVGKFLKGLSKEALAGKKINIIMPDEKLFKNRTVIESDLKYLSKELGFELTIIKPEDVFMKRLEAKLIKNSQFKGQDELLNVSINGQWPDNDVIFEANLKKALSSMKIKGKKVNFMETVKLRVGALPPQEIMDQLKKQLEDIDLLVSFANSDYELKPIIMQLVDAIGIDRGKILAIVDRRDAADDLSKQSIESFVIREEIYKAFAES